MLDFSIICPVYKMNDNLCEKFLIEYCINLLGQTNKNFEIIVSDQSEGDTFKNICDTFSYKLNINFIKNIFGAKIAANNVNNAIKHAKGNLVKILFVDDFFVDSKALDKIKVAFEQNKDKNWLIAGYTHTNYEVTSFFNHKLPRYNELHVLGDNSTGTPSNYTVRRNCALEMDENLMWIVDGEYFYRSYYHYGMPIMLDDILVCFREHKDSKFLDESYRALDGKERAYCLEKYKNEIVHRLI
jgi:hypothetical protein